MSVEQRVQKNGPWSPGWSPRLVPQAGPSGAPRCKLSSPLCQLPNCTTRLIHTIHTQNTELFRVLCQIWTCLSFFIQFFSHAEYIRRRKAGRKVISSVVKFNTLRGFNVNYYNLPLTLKFTVPKNTQYTGMIETHSLVVAKKQNNSIYNYVYNAANLKR